MRCAAGILKRTICRATSLRPSVLFVLEDRHDGEGVVEATFAGGLTEIRMSATVLEGGARAAEIPLRRGVQNSIATVEFKKARRS